MSYHYQKTKKKTELLRALADVDFYKRKEENNGTSNIWYKKQEKREKQEVQNNLHWSKLLQRKNSVVSRKNH